MSIRLLWNLTILCMLSCSCAYARLDGTNIRCTYTNLTNFSGEYMTVEAVTNPGDYTKATKIQAFNRIPGHWKL